eukprot:gene12030-14071_t
MGNAQSQDFKVTGKPLSSYFNHTIIGTTVATRSAFLFYNDRTRQILRNSPTKRNVNIVAFNADLDIYITGEDDFFLRIYRASDGTYLSTLPPLNSEQPAEQIALAHRDLIKVLMFVDDSTVLSGGSDGSMRLWNITTGEMMSMFVAPEQVTAIAFDAKRKHVLAGCTDGIIRRFSLEHRNIVDQLEGHSRGAILNMVITKDGMLLSSSMDRTMRLWNLDHAATVAGSLYFAQVLEYDSYRDIAFAGGDDGIVALIKIEADPANKDKYAIKKLSVLDFKIPSILHLHYNSIADALTATSIESTIGFLPCVSGIPYDDKDLRPIRQFRIESEEVEEEEEVAEASEEEDELELEEVEEIAAEVIENALEQLRRFETSRDNRSRETVAFGERVKKLAELGSDLFDEKDNLSELRRKKYVDGLEQLAHALAELNEDYTQSLVELVDSRAAAVVMHPDSARMVKETDIARRRDEMLARHRAELEAFNAAASVELEQLDSRQPILTRRVVSRFLGDQTAYEATRVDIVESLASHVATLFPLVGSRYHVGSLVSERATTVFRGMDAEQLTPIAIKVLPLGITVDAPVHKHLTRVYGSFETPQATYVAIERAATDLVGFSAEFERHIMPLELIKTVAYQLLDCLAFLHGKGVVMREITPSSVLVGLDKQIRITHLGVMKALAGTLDCASIENGMVYGAPELFCRTVYTSSDMWSLGCLLIHLLQTEEERARPLFFGHSVAAVLESIVKVVGRPRAKDLDDMKQDPNMDKDAIRILDQVGQLPVPLEDAIDVLRRNISRATDSALDLIIHLLQFSPHNRMTASKAMSHRFFSDDCVEPSVAPKPASIPLPTPSNVHAALSPSNGLSPTPFDDFPAPATSVVAPTASSTPFDEPTPTPFDDNVPTTTTPTISTDDTTTTPTPFDDNVPTTTTPTTTTDDTTTTPFDDPIDDVLSAIESIPSFEEEIAAAAAAEAAANDLANNNSVVGSTTPPTPTVAVPSTDNTDSFTSELEL